jgi:hypothetical protein
MTPEQIAAAQTRVADLLTRGTQLSTVERAELTETRQRIATAVEARRSAAPAGSTPTPSADIIVDADREERTSMDNISIRSELEAWAASGFRGDVDLTRAVATLPAGDGTNGTSTSSVAAGVRPSWLGLQGTRTGTTPILDLLPEQVVESATYEYAREVLKANAFAVVAELGLKPEQLFELEDVDGKLAKFAAHIPVSDEARDDVTGLMALIEVRMRSNLRRRIEAAAVQALLGQAAFAVEASGGSVYAAIREGQQQIGDAFGVATHLIMNAATWGAIQDGLMASHPATFNPVTGLARTFDNLPVLLSPGVTGPRVLAAEINSGTVVQMVRSALKIKLGYNGDDIVRNRETLVVEQRAHTAVLRPAALSVVTLPVAA